MTLSMPTQVMSTTAQPSALTRQSITDQAPQSPLILLSRVPLKIGDLTGEIPPPYRAIYGKVLDGLIRTELVNGRHYVREHAVPAIAAMFGRHVPATAAIYSAA